MIKIQDLKINFNGQQILKGINLEIRDKETLVVLGPSGQGKTVLIKTLNRLFEPDSGYIEYDGINILKLNKKKLNEIRKHIAFVFQDSALFDFLDVRKNLSLFLIMYQNMPQNEIDTLLKKVLTFVGLEQDILDKFPEELSGGMKKRVAIARAMIKQPRYIFYDEPTTGLDKTNSEKVSELIKILKNKISATSIIVTHDIKLMREISDRVALLKDGRIVFVGKKEEISDNILQDLYNGDNLK